MDNALFILEKALISNQSRQNHLPQEPPHGIAYTVICTLCIMANILLVCVILKYKELNTPTYIYIKHWFIFNIIFLFDLTVFYAADIYFTLTEFFVSFQIEAIVQFCTAMLLLFLTFDCYVKEKDTAIRIMIYLYSFIITGFVMSYLYNFLITFQVVQFVLHVGIFALVLTKVFLHLLKRKESFDEDQKFRIKVVLSYMVLWTINHVWFFVFLYGGVDALFLSALLNLSLGVASSLFIVILIYCLDRNFRICCNDLYGCGYKNLANSYSFTELHQTNRSCSDSLTRII